MIIENSTVTHYSLTADVNLNQTFVLVWTKKLYIEPTNDDISQSFWGQSAYKDFLIMQNWITTIKEGDKLVTSEFWNIIIKNVKTYKTLIDIHTEMQGTLVFD